MVKDVIDGLKLVADGMKSVKEIADAVKSGKDYVTTKHADVKNDLRLLVGELTKSLLLIKQASAALTNFRFSVSADNQGLELARFNDYFIRSKTEAQHLENHIDDLRTHCSKIREHAQRIAGAATMNAFKKIIAFLGTNSPDREDKLGAQLFNLAYEDHEFANSGVLMVNCLLTALKDVQNALGDGGAMHPENVPNAASLLAAYGLEFEKIEEQAAKTAKDVRELAKELQ